MARFHFEADVLKNPIFFFVSEPHIFKGDFTFEVGDHNGILRTRDAFVFAQDVKDAFTGNQCTLQDIELFGKSLDRFKQPFQVGVIGDDQTDRQDAGEHFKAADQKQQDEGGDANHINRRTINRKGKQLLHVGFLQVITDADKTLIFALLLVEDLDDFHARKVLRQVGIHTRDVKANLTINLAVYLLKEIRKQDQDGNRAQHNHRKVDVAGIDVVDDNNRSHDPNDGHKVTRHVDQNARVHFRQGLSVIGDACHQDACRYFVQIADRLILQVIEGLFPNVINDRLTRALNDHLLVVRHKSTEHRCRCINQQQIDQLLGRKRRIFKNGKRLAKQNRLNQLQGDAQKH